MNTLLKSFPTGVKYYLWMNTLISFGGALSGVFLSVFLWQIDKTFSLLAKYSLYMSLSILLSFGICGWLARKSSPMITMRFGIVFYLLTYLLTLVLKNNLANHIILLGVCMGLAISLYAVGAHMAILEMTTNEGRDKFLYIQSVMTTSGGLLAPLLAGFLIEQFDGFVGYYIVFTLTSVFFILAILASLKIKGQPIDSKSYLMDVLLKAPREWNWMYTIMFTDGIVSGVYHMFLISMMIFHVAGGELNLGIFNLVAEGISIISLLILAKYSRSEHRMMIYSIGTIFIFLSSVFLSFQQTLIGLVVFAFIKPIAMNMMTTTMNTMIYASIESDPLYKKRRLDYIIVREIPLGLGRMLGVFLFLTMDKYLDLDQLLPVSFAFFPFIYVLMVPLLIMIRNKKPNDSRVLAH